MTASRCKHWGIVALLLACRSAMGAPDIATVRAGFVQPPDDSRVMMRWWWFGPAVSKPELQREIRAMKAGGLGGFEIQPVYPVSLDDPGIGLRNLTYLSDEFIDAVRFAAQEGRAQGLRVDITLGSGWPFGGPHVPVTQASSQIRMVPTAVAQKETSVAAPRIGAGEKLLGAFLANGTPDKLEANTVRALPLPTGARVEMPPKTAGARTVLFFVQTRTGQQVKRPGLGGEGFVLDHMSRAAVDSHLNIVGERLMTAFGNQPPTAVFSDSLEVYNADWTDDLPQEFKRRRGYDLLPLLPSLFLDTGAQALNIRHDWAQTLAELVDERYLTPVNQWAQGHRTQFRSQTYGFPPVTLSSNALVALPEGEGHEWRRFSTTRWASSANHLYSRAVTSAESWTWLHSPSFRGTPLDMKAEADVLFLQGVNQLIGHGWPYTPPGVSAPGWSLYAAAVFSDQNPWWLAMPDISQYLQRLSFLLRQGEAVNDVAILMPTNDAWASTTPGRATVSDEMRNYVTDALTTQLLDAGYGFDYIDSGAIDKLAGRYKALVLPRVTRIDLPTYRRIEQFARTGGIVIAMDKPPSLGAGYKNAAVQSREVQSLSQKLFRSLAHTKVVTEDADLASELRKLLEPDLQLAQEQPAIGFVHRRVADGEIYFVANTGSQTVSVDARFRDGAGKTVSQWNPRTGSLTALAGEQVALRLAPYESTVLVFGGKVETGSAPGARTIVADISKDWQLEFAPLKIKRQLKSLSSWTDDEKTRYYSGVGIYRRSVALPASNTKARSGAAASGTRYILSFGEGAPVAPDARQRGGRAWFESPVREAAEVYVNGKRAGAVWAPPYELDITAQLQPGRNQLELRVGNLAINTLAGQAPADYRLLHSRYGERFTPQDMENLQPLAAGLIGTSPITLLAETPSR